MLRTNRIIYDAGYAECLGNYQDKCFSKIDFDLGIDLFCWNCLNASKLKKLEDDVVCCSKCGEEVSF